MNRRNLALTVFLLLTFGLTWAIEIILVSRQPVGSAAYVAILAGVMFIPGLSALFVRLAIEREGFADAGARWGRGRFYLAAWLLPPLFAAIAMLLAIWLKQAEFDPYLTETLAQVALRSPDARIPPLPVLRLSIILGSLTAAVIINFIPALGEEFGWRGYLLMRLLPLGTRKAMIITGAIWGLWHAPIILQGHNYPQHPLLGVPLMTSFCIFIGVIFAWLRLASGSVFTAAVGHASLNGPGSTPFVFLRGRNDLTTGLTGILGQAVMLAFVLLLLRWRALDIARTPIQGEADAGNQVPQPRPEQRSLPLHRHRL